MLVVLTVVGATALAIQLAHAPGAGADSKPAGGPATVSADALPTAQIDGVVYSQVINGNTVYAGGRFANARPAGAAPGSNTVARSDLMAYSLSTGVLTSFAPTLNGEVHNMALSPNGLVLYVVGNFTVVDGQSHPYIVAFNARSGAIISTFTASLNAQARAVTATNAAVYTGGDFTTADGAPASRLAAFAATTGTALAWSASTDDSVLAMTMSPDLSRVVVAGRFTHLDGASYGGIGAVSAGTGALTAWTSDFPISDTGPNTAITDLSADSARVYGTAYLYGTGGNFEGRFALDADTGTLLWVDSCHGDSYSVASTGTVVYSASHAHDCSDDSSFDDLSNDVRAQAETAYRTGITAHNNETTNANYFDHAGLPANSILPWSPDFTAGTYTGLNQAAWSVATNGSYAVFGGEFPAVNGIAQQGLVRFAVSSIAPNQVGPVTSAGLTPAADSSIAGTVRVQWGATYDQDNAQLTYALYRDRAHTPVYTTSAPSLFYQHPQLAYVDTGLPAGSTQTYYVKVTDPFGNGYTSAVSPAVTVASRGSRSAYETSVAADGPTSFWPLSDTSATLVHDDLGANPLTLGSSSDVTRGVAGPPAAGSTKATTFDGTSDSAASAIYGSSPTPAVTVEAWIRTTVAGGQIVDYGLSRTGQSAIVTNSLYLDNTGKPHFAVWTSSGYQALGGPNAVDDGNWHLLTATLSYAAGSTLYVDGRQVSADAALKVPRQIFGYWRLGGDAVQYLPSAPSNIHFSGTLADVAVYPLALSTAQIADHFSG